MPRAKYLYIPMYPIRPNTPSHDNVIEPERTSANTGVASLPEPAWRKQAHDAIGKAAELLSQGLRARLVKDKIDLLMQARAWNQTACQAFAGAGPATESLRQEWAAYQKQGADITEPLLAIREQQFNIEPDENAKKQRLNVALTEASMIEGQMRSAGPSAGVEDRMRWAVPRRMNFLNLMAFRLENEAKNASGRESIELLHGAIQHAGAALRGARDAGLESTYLQQCREMQDMVCRCAAFVSNEAYNWIEDLWFNFSALDDKATTAEQVDECYEFGVFCMNEGPLVLASHKALFQASKDFLEDAEKFKRSDEEIKQWTEIKLDARQRYFTEILTDVTRCHFLLDTRIRGIDESDEEAQLLRVSTERLREAYALSADTVFRLRVMGASTAEELARNKEVLPDLIQGAQDRIESVEWLLQACRQAGRTDETLLHEINRLGTSISRMKHALEVEYNEILASEKPAPGGSRLQRQFAAAMQIQDAPSEVPPDVPQDALHHAPPVSKKRKGKKKKAKAAPASAPEETRTTDAQSRVIDTRFNGKLVGVAQGDKVVVQGEKHATYEFQHDGEKWARCDEPAETAEEAQAEESAQAAGHDPAEKARLKVDALLTRVEDSVEKMKRDAMRYRGLSRFADRRGAPFSESHGIFNLAMSEYQKAIFRMNKALAKSASAGLSASDMSACRERLESLRDDIDNQRRIAMEERTDEVKKYPSGGALEYLLDEGKVSAVRKTIFRQALTGPNIPLGKQDFMDEILCDIEGAETWEVHAHFRDKNARLRNATAIHVRARGGDKDVRPPVTVALLERLENLAAG